MDGKLVSGSPPKKRTTYNELFEELCPQYIAFGMTYEQFWDGDPQMVVAYRKAQIIKDKQTNTHMWILGTYVYEAICKVAPILGLNAKKGAKPIEWRKRPYPLTKKEIEEEKIIRQKESDQKCKAFFEKTRGRG